ncbi:MAG: hypothetical protein IT209_09605 [Armatimonadetes bacterium]|nr:hypothetical protein [Armatimonadota bacterium]
MKFQILGTAAAEGWPALFCACDPCRRARAAGGKNIRSRASVLVNDNIKVDFNSDEFHHLSTLGLDYSQLEHLLFTHSHNDHFSTGELAYLRDPFAHNRKKNPLDIWCSADVANIIQSRYPDEAAAGMSVHAVKPFETIGLDGMPATPITAIHKHDELCLNWLFGPLDNCVLYASDTGFYQPPTWEFLKNVKLNMVVSECTLGFTGESETHMSVNSVRRMKDELVRLGSLKPSAQFVITHFSHNALLLHDEMQERVKDDGFVVAYDGIILEAGP